MNRYEVYSVADFIQDEAFRDWVQGHSQQEAFWLSFPDRYPNQRDAFRQAERFIRSATVTEESISEADIRKETERFIEQAGAYLPDRPRLSHPPPAYTRWWGLAIAALLALLLGIGWSVSRTPSTPGVAQANDAPTTHLVETYNDTKQLLRVTLPDGSVVWLSPKSRLRYPAPFARHARIVYLSGEANFSVQRNSQPFMVYTGDMVTKVLGTRFVVRAFDTDRKMTVQVLSGKVSVYKAKPDRVAINKEVKGLILTPNQAAIFEKSDGNLTKTVVANPSLVVMKRGQPVSFSYDEVALPRILREIETGYGIPIQFDESCFTDCRITADLSAETLYQKLDLLCKAAAATYEITDGQIVISRKEFQTHN